MARGRDRLSDRQVRTAKPKGQIIRGANAGQARDSLLLADGGNLYLQVTTGADGVVVVVLPYAKRSPTVMAEMP